MLYYLCAVINAIPGICMRVFYMLQDGRVNKEVYRVRR